MVYQFRLPALPGIVAMLLALPAAGQTFTYTRGAGTDGWGNPGNWDPTGPPTDGSTVIIPLGFPRIVCWSPDLILNAITVDSPLYIGTYDYTFGTATFNQGVELDLSSLTVGTLLMTGENYWKAGVITAGSFLNTGSLWIQTPGATAVATTLDASVLINQGEVIANRTLFLTNNAEVLNNGTWTAQTGGSVTKLATPGTFRNLGTFEAAGSVQASLPFHNGSTVSATSGTFTLNGGGDHAGGSFSAGSGATLSFSNGALTHRFTGTVTMNGEGTIQITGSGTPRIEPEGSINASMSLSSPNGLWINAAGQVDVTGGIHNSGLMKWSGGALISDNPDTNLGVGNGSSGLLHILGGRLGTRLLNNGNIEQRGTLLFDPNGAALNLSEGTWTIFTGHLGPAGGVTNVSFEVEGLLLKPEGPGVSNTNLNVPTFFLDARLRVEQDLFSLAPSPQPHEIRVGQTVFEALNSGKIAIASNTTLIVRPNAQLVTSGSGTFAVTGGTLQLDAKSAVNNNMASADYQSFSLESGGRILGSGLFFNTGTFRWSSGEVSLPGVGGFVNFNSVYTTAGSVGTVAGNFLNQGTFEQRSGFVHITGPGSVENAGTWIMRDSATITTGLLRNQSNGILVRQAGGGGGASISASLDNEGLIAVESGTLSLAGSIEQLVDTTLTGGRWIVEAAGTLRTNGRLIHTLSGATVQIGLGSWPELQLSAVSNNAGLFIPWGEVLDTGPGKLHLNSGGKASLSTPARLEVGGDIEVEDVLSEIDEVYTGGLPRGFDGPIGYVAPNVNNAGDALPGGRGIPGPLHITGNYNQLPGGTLHVDIAGLTPVGQHDQLIVDGNITLDGTLRLHFLNTYVPDPGTTFVIGVATGTINGVFADVDIHGLPATLSATAHAEEGQLIVRIAPACPADLAPPFGNLNFFDVQAFLAAFSSQADSADLNDDASFNFFDVQIYLNAFADGCSPD